MPTSGSGTYWFEGQPTEGPVSNVSTGGQQDWFAGAPVESLLSTITTTQTIDGQARVQVTQPRTITGQSRVQGQVDQTITGQARVQAQVSRIITGQSRVQVRVPQTITGQSAVQNVTARTIAGQSAVQNVTSRTITGQSAVQNTTTRNLTGQARIIVADPGSLEHIIQENATDARLIDFYDGFDHYDSEDFVLKWDPTSGLPTSMVSGRRGGYAAQYVNIAEPLRYNLSEPSNTVSVLFAIRVSAVGGTTRIAQLLDRSASQIELVLQPSGQLSLEVNGSQIGLTSDIIVPDAWQFIEWITVVNRVRGSSIIRLDGDADSQFQVDHVNTRGSTGSDKVTQVAIGTWTPDNGVEYTFDDFLVARSAYMPGRIRVQTLFPQAPGSNEGWTPVGESTNWEAVGEYPLDTSTYVKGQVVGDLDSYDFYDSDLETGIVALQQVLTARRDGVDLQNLQPVVVFPGSALIAGAITPCDLGNKSIRSVYTQNDLTELPWTLADVNAAEYGQRIAPLA